MILNISNQNQNQNVNQNQNQKSNNVFSPYFDFD